MSAAEAIALMEQQAKTGQVQAITGIEVPSVISLQQTTGISSSAAAGTKVAADAAIAAVENTAEEAKETPAEQAAEDKAGVEMTEAEKAALKAKQAKEKAAPEKVDPATDLAKAGARNSKADAAELQKAHDALNAAGARCNKAFIFADSDPGDVTTSKDNPGNSGATAQAKIDSPSTAIQDKAEPSGDLKKALDETAALRKIVEDQAKDIALLKAQPATPRIRLRAVGKGEETLPLDEKVDKVEAVKDAHGKEHGVATLIKGIHQTGGEDLYKFR